MKITEFTACYCRGAKCSLIAAVWLFTAHSPSTIAQQASLNGNVINLPVVIAGEKFYQVELTIVAGTNPLEFNLTSGVEIFEASDNGASTFSGTTLSIPSISTIDLSYWVDLSLISASPIRFQLINAGIKHPLNDTGLTFGGDYEQGKNSTCSGETISQQDCSTGRDATHNDDSDGHAGFSFTKLDTLGKALAADAINWFCVKDNVTGLVWEVKTSDDSIHSKDITYRWGGKGASRFGTEFYNDWDVLLDGSNNELLCGFSDWRVPSVDELEGITNFGTISGASVFIDTHYFPHAHSFTSTDTFWTTSALAEDSSFAWFIGYFSGSAGAGPDFFRNVYLQVRLVRGGQ